MERMAFRAQTIVADVALSAVAFTLAYLVASSGAPSLDLTGVAALSLVQLTVLYAALAGGFTMLFRRELSPWRYASIPDALVLARIAVLTVSSLPPALIITAADDPFVPSPPFLDPHVTDNPFISLRLSEYGGHCAFVGPQTPDNDGYWAESQIVDFVARHALTR